MEPTHAHESGPRRLAIAGKPTLARHPADRWFAELYPVGGIVGPAMRGVIRALCPPPPAPSSPEIFDAVERYVRGFMRYMPRLVAFGLAVVFVLLDWSPLWLGKSWRRLRKLDHERAAAVLARLDESRSSTLRTLVVAVRGAVLSGYFDQDVVHRELGYEPIPFLQERIALRESLLVRREPEASAS